MNEKTMRATTTKDDDEKTMRVTVRMTAAERDELQAAADRDHRPLSTYMLTRSLEAARAEADS